MIIRPQMLRLMIAFGLVATVLFATVQSTYAAKGRPAGKENTVVLVQNLGNQPADIALDVYTPGGLLVKPASRVTIGVAPGATTQFPQAVNNGLVAGFRGFGVISASQPVNSIIVRDILRPTATAAKSYSLVGATADGGHTLAMPLLLNELLTFDWNSRISIVNVGSAPACVVMTYYLLPNAGGSTGSNPQTVEDNGPGCLGGAGYTVNGGSQLTFSPEPGDTNFPASTSNNQMAALAVVRNAAANNTIAATVEIYRSDGNRLLGSYNAPVYNPDDAANDDVGTDVVLPIAMKSTSGFYTVAGIMNLGQSAADVKITYEGQLADGTGVSNTTEVTLPAVQKAAFHSTYQAGTNVPLGFVGSARITSSQPLAVVEIRGKLTSSNPPGDAEPIYTAVNGVPIERAATKWTAPLYFRRFAPGPPGTLGYNSWVQVIVADGTTAAVTLRFAGDPTSGCPVGPYEATFNVTGSRVFYANLDADNGFPVGQTPNCFFGGLTVTTSKPTIIINQVGADKFPGGDSEGVSNSFPAN
ncbi:MAG: hypothetical protein R3C29_13965 [Dehalococcoidia bacterium]|nr:hypothetical protein [Dehalococcoidia bacterium]